jgi:chromosome segregation ATPase
MLPDEGSMITVACADWNMLKARVADLELQLGAAGTRIRELQHALREGSARIKELETELQHRDKEGLESGFLAHDLETTEERTRRLQEEQDEADIPGGFPD